MPIPLLAIGAALGLTKHFAVDAPRERRQRKLAAETQRLSPWTGLSAGPIQEPDLLGSVISSGLTGQQIADGAKMNDLNGQLMQKALGGGTPMPVAGVMPGAPGGNPWSVLGQGGMPQLAQPGTMANPWGGVGGGWR